MAEEEKQRVNDALETRISITEKSGNLKKDLKKDIHESVSTLRNAFSLIYKQLENIKEYNSYRKEVNNTTKGQRPVGPTRAGLLATSVEYTLRPENNSTQHMTPPTRGRGKLY
jgi:hypothetical protein